MSVFKKIKRIFVGASGDSFFLIFVRLVTMLLSLVMTRLLSQKLSILDYGTYSQIMLIVSTIASMTILGMMDGMNFFYCKERTEERKSSYVSTIFFLQFVINFLTSIVILACAIPISKYFGNNAIKSLIWFAALLPVLQNTLALLQVLFIAIGKAKIIALRNVIVSCLKLFFVFISLYKFDSIVAILGFQIVLEIVQVVYFYMILKKNNCLISFLKIDFGIIKEILKYCVPMAMFTVVSSMTRDCDKYIISFFTNTETLAVYTNASKMLPFDIIMTSFCTILIPYITKYIAEKKFKEVENLYKVFLEITYISTSILAVGALCVAPELIELLYTSKYISGLNVFSVYILVDIFRFLSITLILSASGKTKTIMYTSIVSLLLNIVLNVPFYFAFGIVGPALATLIVTMVNGFIVLSVSAREIKSKVLKMFDLKYLIIFLIETLSCAVIAYLLKKAMIYIGFNNIVVLFAIYGLYIIMLASLNLKRLLKDMNLINEYKLGSV